MMRERENHTEVHLRGLHDLAELAKVGPARPQSGVRTAQQAASRTGVWLLLKSRGLVMNVAIDAAGVVLHQISDRKHQYNRFSMGNVAWVAWPRTCAQGDMK